MIPLTTNIVAISFPLSTGSAMPRASESINGIATVEPNIVR